jgi:hypothetical protein
VASPATSKFIHFLEKGWHPPASPVVLPLNLRDQFLNIVQAPACSQPQFVRSGAIRAGSRRFINRHQTGAKRLVHHPSKGNVERPGNTSSSAQEIVVYGQRHSHDVTASSCQANDKQGA